MAWTMIVVTAFLAVFCATDALKCNSCTRISQDQPTCMDTDIEEVECGGHFTHCTRITMNSPAYGQVMRCATTTECEADVLPIVDRYCCTSDLCNGPASP